MLTQIARPPWTTSCSLQAKRRSQAEQLPRTLPWVAGCAHRTKWRCRSFELARWTLKQSTPRTYEAGSEGKKQERAGWLTFFRLLCSLQFSSLFDRKVLNQNCLSFFFRMLFVGQVAAAFKISNWYLLSTFHDPKQKHKNSMTSKRKSRGAALVQQLGVRVDAAEHRCKAVRLQSSLQSEAEADEELQRLNSLFSSLQAQSRGTEEDPSSLIAASPAAAAVHGKRKYEVAAQATTIELDYEQSRMLKTFQTLQLVLATLRSRKQLATFSRCACTLRLAAVKDRSRCVSLLSASTRVLLAESRRGWNV